MALPLNRPDSPSSAASECLSISAAARLATFDTHWPLLQRSQGSVFSFAADATSSQVQMQLFDVRMRELGLVPGRDYALEDPMGG
jgi:hypothetical protein